MKLTKLEKYVYENVNQDNSLEELATQLNRSVQAISVAFNRACRKVAFNAANSIDRFNKEIGA